MGYAAKEEPCAERQRLVEQFADATRKFSEAVGQLAQHRGTTLELEYYKLRILVDEARQDSERAGLALERHISMHCC
jgi:hypothetical protein